jgi:hypothetical protein
MTTKKSNAKTQGVTASSKKESLTNANASTIANQIGKRKYLIDYTANAKEQKNARNQRRNKLQSFAKSIFQFNMNKETPKESKEDLKKNLLTFFKDNYSFPINASTPASEIWNTKDESKLKDIRSCIDYAFAK